MAYYMSPWVYVKEEDKTNTIPAVSTSIAMLVLRNPKLGPEFKRNLITTEDELEQVFGPPTNDKKNYCDYFSAIGYLKYGRNLYVTGVRPADATFAGVVSRLTDTGTPGVSGDSIVYTGELGKDSFDIPDTIVNDGTSFLFVSIEGLLQTENDDYRIDYVNHKIIFDVPPAANSTILIRVFSGISLSQAYENNLEDKTELFNFIHFGVAGQKEYDIPASVKVSNGDLYFVTLDGLLQIPGQNYTVDMDRRKLIFTAAPPAGTYIVVRVFTSNELIDSIDPSTTSESDSPFQGSVKVVFETPPVSGDEALTLDDFSTNDPDDFDMEIDPEGPMDLIAKSRGTWGNNIRVGFINSEDYDAIVRKNQISSKFIDKIVGGVPVYKPVVNKLLAIDSPLTAGDNKSFLVFVETLPEGKKAENDNNWDLTEYFNVSTDEKAIDDQGQTKYAVNIINQTSNYIRVSMNERQKNKDWSLTTPDFQQFGGGFEGDTFDTLESEVLQAMNLYDNAEEIDVNIIIDGDKSETIKKAINDLCVSRLDCMGVLDCKYEHVVNNRGSETTTVVNWRKGLENFTVNNLNINSDKVAVYANWAEVYDRWNKKYRWVPLSGFIAGIFAYTDDIADPWIAPAGLNRGILHSVNRLAWSPNLGQRDQLYKNGINPVVTFAGQGNVLWGQKTMLDKESAFNRINVRRLFIVMEKAIATAARYFVFEPNDERTRQQIVNMIVPYLRDVKARRGVYDFEVVCDERNNYGERIDRNELWVDIMVKPVRAAEFIVLTFWATKTDANFSEVLGSA